MSMQNLLSGLRRAVTDYSMISDGDRIAVGLSGGKDSLTLAAALKAYQRFSPQKFELSAITIDMGFKDANFDGLKEFCVKHDIPYHIEQSNIAEILFEIRKESNPCSLCSKMRRGALNSVINKLGFNKLALGHHADDLVETMLLSLFYEGRLSTFAPVSYMDRTAVTVIRPLIYTYEKDIIAYASEGLPIMHNPCPADKQTKRQYVKDLIKSIQKDIPFAKDRMLGALTHPERNNLWDKVKRDDT